jgi:hypothetical protein
MTSEDIRSELDRGRFIPLRLHMGSGKTVDVMVPEAAWMLQNAVLVFQEQRSVPPRAGRYDMIALRNIERIEQSPGSLTEENT